MSANNQISGYDRFTIVLVNGAILQLLIMNVLCNDTDELFILHCSEMKVCALCVIHTIRQ